MALLRALAAALLAGVAVAHAGSVGVGDPAPDFRLSDWKGRPTTLTERRGRVVVVDFWATWCLPCRLILPALDALARRHDGLDVLAVNLDGKREAADRFLAERLPAPALTLLHDPDGAVLSRFGADGMPALYVVDRDGVVRLVETGYGQERLAEVERTVARLLGGR